MSAQSTGYSQLSCPCIMHASGQHVFTGYSRSKAASGLCEYTEESGIKPKRFCGKGCTNQYIATVLDLVRGYQTDQSFAHPGGKWHYSRETIGKWVPSFIEEAEHLCKLTIESNENMDQGRLRSLGMPIDVKTDPEKTWKQYNSYVKETLKSMWENGGDK